MNTISTFIILSIVFGFESVIGHLARFRRNYFNRRNPPKCDVICEGQWKSDFHLNFQKLYETDYFEIPLDAAVIKNRNNLKTFCSITKQKYLCLRNDCNIHRAPWTPEKHICLNQYLEFEKSMSCLSITNKFVQRECSNVCGRIKIKLSRNELNELDYMELNKYEKNALIEQNEHCHFIACHQMCHEFVTNKHCVEKAASTQSTIRKYYEAYLNREYASFKRNDHDELYSSFCRRVTPGQDENLYVKNMTLFNTMVLEHMKLEIHKAF